MKIKKPFKLFMTFVFIFALSFIFSCSSANDGNSSDIVENPNTPDKSENMEEEPENLLYTDGLPDKNYNGEKFKMLTFDFNAANTD